MKTILILLALALAGLGCTAGIVTLSWQQPDPEGVTGWKLYVIGGGATNVVPCSTTNATLNVPFGAQVFATATNQFEESDPSNVITNTTPGAPAGLKKK